MSHFTLFSTHSIPLDFGYVSQFSCYCKWVFCPEL